MQRTLFALSLGFAGVILATHAGWSAPAALPLPVNPAAPGLAGFRAEIRAFRQALAQIPPPAPLTGPEG